jgi:hypothetical protein
LIGPTGGTSTGASPAGGARARATKPLAVLGFLLDKGRVKTTCLAVEGLGFGLELLGLSLIPIGVPVLSLGDGCVL